MSAALLFILLLQPIVNVNAQNYINGAAHPKFESDLPDPTDNEIHPLFFLIIFSGFILSQKHK